MDRMGGWTLIANARTLAEAVLSVKRRTPRGCGAALLFQKRTGNVSGSMRFVRTIAIFAAVLSWPAADRVHAQDDPAREYFSAYQEYQRAERLEREGRSGDAIAKFRYVATQLGQIKSQFPDWQPMVIDFRLGKTKEPILRLEGSLDTATLGPPPPSPRSPCSRAACSKPASFRSQTSPGGDNTPTVIASKISW